MGEQESVDAKKSGSRRYAEEVVERPVRILLVDDREDNLFALAEILRGYGYDLALARSGAEALEHVLEDDFAVILLDVAMPRMSGFETAEWIKKRERSSRIPIIFVTASIYDVSHVYKAYSVGAVDYLPKPVDADVVRAKVAVFVDLYRKSEQIRVQAARLREAERQEQELTRTRAERAQAEAQRFLATASAVLLSSFDLRANLAEVARRSLPLLGDECRIEIPEEEPEETIQVSAGKALPPGNESRRMVVPLAAHGQTIGSLSLFRTEEGDPYERAEKALARELGDRIALAVENARLYLRAQHSIEMRDDFLAVASHELRSPLTSLKLSFQTLLRAWERPDPERFESAVRRAERQLDRLAALVESLLDVTRIASGALRLQPEPLDLMETAREVADRFSDELAESKSVLKISGQAPVRGNWDRLRIEQVMTNLLSNSIKYGRGRPIEISARSRDGNAVLVVRDYGIGIEGKKLERIFDRFERAVSGRSYGGLGLGLYIVRQIVAAHGGRIRATSTPGKGTTIEVELPMSS